MLLMRFLVGERNHLEFRKKVQKVIKSIRTHDTTERECLHEAIFAKYNDDMRCNIA